ncbi:MAG: N-6 DNA methylase [Lentisphaerota bacterium]
MGKAQQRPACEELAKGFEASSVFAHMHSYDLYRKWLEAVWAFLDSANNPEAFKECLDRHKYEEGAEFGRLLGVYTDAVEAMPFRDILGELFMRLDVNSARSGQYVTPWNIAEMMARMQFSREHFEALVAEKGEVTVCDPAVGSGVMLLAYAKVVHDELGREGLGKLRLYGTDIDQRCVLMCRIQLRMNGLDTFGRMAGLLGSLLQKEKPQEALPEPTPLKPDIDTVTAPALPDLSTAIILHHEDRLDTEKRLAEQLTLW